MKILTDIATHHFRAGRWAGIFFLVVSFHFAQAQSWPFELWHEGKIALASGDTLKGLVKYDLQQDLVQYTYRDQQPEVFTARKVLFFEIFEEAIHKYRRFYALPFTTPNGYRSTIFFELLEEGKMTLLAREFVEYRTYSSPYLAGSYSRLVLDYKYFFLKEDATIEEFIGSKNDLLDLMGKKSEEVEKYIKANRLKVDDKQDLTRIVDYYNSLFGG
ncbi:hypothetical protein KK083_15735 [Fulvivirgaceae bacterium PWU4]|uniref:Uncharacterized protein n=1 Tax=Chryseosolibacter histidini TaxID=2782349 RepID=A0AAP2DNI1_9BACT|nr:hypothetical protein [Chryseosolibacter histidini]MBT1698342.1 hypothetical protein [Chryseosolibacter histidini]